MHGHFFSVLLSLSPSALMDFPGSSQYPTWFGFALGVLGGAASSCLLIGLVLGYSLAGSFPSLPSARGGSVAQNPPSAPTPPSAPNAPAKAVPPLDTHDHVRGNSDAKVTVIEYSDFECPFCKRHAPTMVQVLSTYKNDVNIAFRHFPLSFHQNAHKEAEASE